MNSRQRIVVLVGAAVFAAMLLFPPWQRTTSGFRAVTRGGSYSRPSKVIAGYGFVFYPPQNAEAIDTSRLLVQFAAVGAVVARLYVVFAHRKEG